MSEFLKRYFEDIGRIASQVDVALLSRMVDRLKRLRTEKGRLFLCGVGGSAANCSHAANDFRKLAQIEAYAPTDNVAELTARINDEGWETVFSAWLQASHASSKDVLMVLSVGGGSLERNISMNLVKAVDESKRRRMDILGIVGRDGGYTAHEGDLVIVVPTVCPEVVTAHQESFQAVIWHALVFHPDLLAGTPKWESQK